MSKLYELFRIGHTGCQVVDNASIVSDLSSVVVELLIWRKVNIGSEKCEVSIFEFVDIRLVFPCDLIEHVEWCRVTLGVTGASKS